MREKYILRMGATGESEAWVLGVYFTPRRRGSRVGTLTVGGPKVFVDEVNEVLTFFDFLDGIESKGVEERQAFRKGMRKRRVFDAEGVPRWMFRRGVRRIEASGVTVTKVKSLGRLLR
jgi:hypothetical protein